MYLFKFNDVYIDNVKVHNFVVKAISIEQAISRLEYRARKELNLREYIKIEVSAKCNCKISNIIITYKIYRNDITTYIPIDEITNALNDGVIYQNAHHKIAVKKISDESNKYYKLSQKMKEFSNKYSLEEFVYIYIN